MSFSFFLISINIENIIYIITSLIDIITIVVIAVTLFQTIISLLKKNIKLLLSLSLSLSSKRQSYDTNLKIVKRNFVSGLVLALEFEAANAILKMGVFLSQAVNISSISTATASATAVTSENFINNFLLFAVILAVRIAINYTVQRFV